MKAGPERHICCCVSLTHSCHPRLPIYQIHQVNLGSLRVSVDQEFRRNCYGVYLNNQGRLGGRLNAGDTVAGFALRLRHLVPHRTQHQGLVSLLSVVCCFPGLISLSSGKLQRQQQHSQTQRSRFEDRTKHREGKREQQKERPRGYSQPLVCEPWP